MTTFLTIPPTGKPEFVEVPGAFVTLAPLQKAIGGYVETLGLTDDLTLWVNEDGIALGLQPNHVAAHLVVVLTGQFHRLYGTAVLTGGVDEDGETLGLTPEQVAQFTGAEV